MSGWIQSVDARQIALVTMALGAARDAPGESIDPSVGVVLRRKVADRVQSGEPLAEVHAATPAEAGRAARQVRAAFQMADVPTAPARPILLDPLES